MKDDVEFASAIGSDDWDGDVVVSVRRDESGDPHVVFWPRGWDELDGEARELVERVQAVVVERQRLLTELEDLVVELRRAGASWTVIGWCTGMTQQAAHKRWSHVEQAPAEPVGRRQLAASTDRRRRSSKGKSSGRS